MRHDFATAPAGKLPWLFILGLLVLVPLLVVGLSAATDRSGQQAVPYEAIGVLWLAVAGIAMLARRRSVAIEDGRLVVRAALHTRRIALADLPPEQARIVDLREHREWRPVLRSNGLGLPGLKLGHFRSRGLGKLFCVLTDPSRVLVLPVRDGPTLLLSLERPQALLDALRAMR